MMTSDAPQMDLAEKRGERRSKEKWLSETESRLDDAARRDYGRRLDAFKAMEAIAPSVFLERVRLMDRQAYLNRIPTNKWLWGTAIVGGILAYLDFSFGKFLLGACGLLWISSAIENLLVDHRLRSIKERLSELCYRWIANGLDEKDFWTFGHLEVRLSNLSPSNEVEVQKYHDERDEWWFSVQKALLGKSE